ncbi:hypothetical protein ACQJBY_010452 [Aegilops geniculata]
MQPRKTQLGRTYPGRRLLSSLSILLAPPPPPLRAPSLPRVVGLPPLRLSSSVIPIPRFLSLSLQPPPAATPSPTADSPIPFLLPLAPSATSPPPRTRSSSMLGRVKRSGDGRRWADGGGVVVVLLAHRHAAPVRSPPAWLLSQARRGVVALRRGKGEQPNVLKAIRGGCKSRRRLQIEGQCAAALSPSHPLSLERKLRTYWRWPVRGVVLSHRRGEEGEMKKGGRGRW